MTRAGTHTVLELDGAQGEGGGQVLRTALALSLCLQVPVRLFNIRARRRRPGLQRQHLAAVRAAAAVGRAEVEGAVLGSQTLAFRPRTVQPGRYRFDIGTAGSTTLVLQTVLPALVTAPGPSRIELCGGTHNPLAPPFEFLQRAFVPLLERMGPRVTLALKRPGFYPAGGGRLRAEIAPVERLRPLELADPGPVVEVSATALLSHLPEHIGRRELETVRRGLALAPRHLHLERVDAAGPGNVVFVEARRRKVTEIFTGFGRRGVPAEQVAEEAVAQARAWLGSGAAVDPFLADQLLLPLALAGGGRYTTTAPTRHATTNMDVIAAFTGDRFQVRELENGRWEIAL